MSRENVEVARRAYELLNEPGEPLIRLARELAVPDFEVDLSSTYPDGPVLRGAAVENLHPFDDLHRHYRGSAPPLPARRRAPNRAALRPDANGSRYQAATPCSYWGGLPSTALNRLTAVSE